MVGARERGLGMIPFDHIYVHTLPRTGGTTIARFLRDALAERGDPCKVYHVHHMTNRYRQNHIWPELLEPLQGGTDNRRIGIITCSRDPVARNVSEFWRFPAWRIGGAVYTDPQAAAAWFYAHVDHWAQHTWHGTKLAHFWELDPFGSVKCMWPPGLIFQQRLCMTRLENIRQLPLLVSEWLGVDVCANPVPHEEARRAPELQPPPLPIRPTAAYLSAMYQPVGDGWIFPAWWYSRAELDEFRARWETEGL